MFNDWKEIKPRGFWGRLLHGLFVTTGFIDSVGSPYQYINDEGVLFRIHRDGHGSLEPNSLIRSPSFKRHLHEMDMFVKSRGGVPFTLDKGPD